MKFILGARGRLGEALVGQYGNGIAALDRGLYAEWMAADAPDRIARYFMPRMLEDSVIFVASGLLDPSLSEGELTDVNFHLPRRVIEAVASQGVPVVTFGTVMEGLLAAPNPYVRSKALLGDYVAGMAARGWPVLHVRIHTLYGGAGLPSPFMFLGQMFEALRRGKRFSMTQGRQLREYHHVHDEARAIQAIVGAKCRAVMDLSHGRPVSLRDIALGVFGACGEMDKLGLGDIVEPAEDNYGRILARPAVLENAAFRDAVPGIIDYVKVCLGSLEHDR